MGAAAMTGIVGSAIGAGSSLIGGIAGTGMQNAANKEIAQMNNAFNEKMFDKQVAYNKEMYQQQLGDQWKFYNDSKQNAWDLVANQQQFQTDMWNKNNEYNSASSQRERLEAAGLNPYLMMNGGSAGTAQAMSGSAGSAPSLAAPSSRHFIFARTWVMYLLCCLFDCQLMKEENLSFLLTLTKKAKNRRIK